MRDVLMGTATGLTVLLGAAIIIGLIIGAVRSMWRGPQPPKDPR